MLLPHNRLVSLGLAVTCRGLKPLGGLLGPIFTPQASSRCQLAAEGAGDRQPVSKLFLLAHILLCFLVLCDGHSPYPALLVGGCGVAALRSAQKVSLAANSNKSQGT